MACFDIPFIIVKPSHNPSKTFLGYVPPFHRLGIKSPNATRSGTINSGFLLPAAVHVDLENFFKAPLLPILSILQPQNGLDLVFYLRKSESGGGNAFSIDPSPEEGQFVNTPHDKMTGLKLLQDWHRDKVMDD
ncbi:hypothetical protein ABEW05_000801 [Botrytis cinerea]